MFRASINGNAFTDDSRIPIANMAAVEATCLQICRVRKDPASTTRASAPMPTSAYKPAQYITYNAG